MATIESIKYSTPAQPRQVRLDTVANICNALCPSCHRHNTARKGVMPKDMVKRIIDNISNWRNLLVEVIPVNYGEFFLYEHWEWLLNEIAEKLPKTNIVIPTNGSKIDDDLLEIIIKIPNIRIINFSVNAYFRETYTQFMGFSQKIMDGIKNACISLRLARPDISLWVSMVHSPIYQTDLERDLFIDYWKPYAIPQIINAASAGRSDNKPLYPVKLPCRSIFSDFVIGYDGKLSSCCFDAGFILDIDYLQTYHGNILEAWRNPKIEELRNDHNQGRRTKYGLCAKCSFA